MGKVKGPNATPLNIPTRARAQTEVFPESGSQRAKERGTKDATMYVCDCVTDWPTRDARANRTDAPSARRAPCVSRLLPARATVPT